MKDTGYKYKNFKPKKFKITAQTLWRRPCVVIEDII